MGFGLFSLLRLNLDLYPDMQFPMLAIITQYTGVGPFDIETVITRPIEETISAVENVNKVSSTSTQGFFECHVIIWRAKWREHFC